MGVLSRFRIAKRGNAVLTFSAALPLLLGAAGGAMDYANLVRARLELQSVADGAALAGAKELRLAGSQDSTVVAVAENFVRGSLPNEDVAFTGAVGTDRNHVDVTLKRTVSFFLPQSLTPLSSEIAASAEAQAFGGAPTCLMGLDTSENATVSIDRAGITAPGCAVYANSASSGALEVVHDGSVRASLVCSSGGADVGGGSVSPPPRLDCPQSPDPMADRPPPSVGACDYTDFRASGMTVMTPGVYCGGIRLDSGAVATLLPGIYVVKDGPLLVDNNAALTGVEAGFYFTGADAVFDIKPATTIKLTAPSTGPLAGVLFFEDRANAASTFRIRSRDALLLLGTFYMPKSKLEVGAPGGLGIQKSDVGRLAAWTIIVARTVSVGDGLNLTLNTDYGASRVPVPEGLGGAVALVK